jgi:hypothetical protein
VECFSPILVFWLAKIFGYFGELDVSSLFFFFLYISMKFYKSVRHSSKYTGSIHKETPKKVKKNEQENQKS